MILNIHVNSTVYLMDSLNRLILSKLNVRIINKSLVTYFTLHLQNILLRYSHRKKGIAI